MQYRKFGKLGWDVSALGFGMMRLPENKDTREIDEDLATEMVHKAIDAGVNYVDTAWGYHNEKSEPFVGRVLKGGYREKVHLATKLPVWLVKSESDLDRLLDEQQRRLDVDHLDMYLFHALGGKRWLDLQQLKILNWAEKRKSEGRFLHLGFSFHDDYDAFHTILNSYDAWDFCQLQHNYMDIDYQQGQKGVDEAAAKGLGVVVMEPIRGGNLALDPMPDQVAREFARSPRGWKPAEWALQWVWNQPQVSVVLSGMSKQNLRAADASRPGLLTAEELALVARVRDLYRELSPVPCTACRYCMPCPQGVDIPGVFELYNDAHMYGNLARQQMAYRDFLADGERADSCTACGECVEKCPQGIAVPEWLERAQAFLAPC